MAAIGKNVRRQYTRRTSETPHLLHQFIRRPMSAAARITFVGDDLVANKGLNFGGDRIRAFGHDAAVTKVALATPSGP